MTEGIVVLADDDYEFETIDGRMIPWNHHTESHIHIHHYYQAGMSKPGHTICKIDTGLLIKHDEKERLVCLLTNYDPMDSAVDVMPADLPILQVWTPFLINTVYKNGHHHIKKGDPIARAIIAYAGNFQYADEVQSKKSDTDDWFAIKDHSDSTHGALTTFNKELKKCPFHNPS